MQKQEKPAVTPNPHTYRLRSGTPILPDTPQNSEQDLTIHHPDPSSSRPSTHPYPTDTYVAASSDDMSIPTPLQASVEPERH